MSATRREQVSDPTVTATAAAHAVTDSVLNVMFEQMTACGFTDRSEIGEDQELRRLIWLMVLRRIARKRGVVAAAIGRTSEPTSIQALFARGAVDMAAGLEDLSKTLAKAVTNELCGYVHESRVRSAIRRAIVDLLNTPEFAASGKADGT